MPVEQRGVGPVVWDRTKAGTAIKTDGYPGVGHHVSRGRRQDAGDRHHHHDVSVGSGVSGGASGRRISTTCQ